jgi:hypothetical protein
MKQLKAIWFKYFFTKTPWAAERKVDGMLVIDDYNQAYPAYLRTILPQDLTSGLTDDDVIGLWVDRYNREHAEPRLEVVHAGIDSSGKIKMKLDWNNAFIQQLYAQGIEGDTEEEMVEQYLTMVTHQRHYEDLIASYERDDKAQPRNEDEFEIGSRPRNPYRNNKRNH